MLTVDALGELERATLLRALESTGWWVGGGDGAARLLGTRPSTLRSRMDVPGIRKAADQD